MTTVEEIFAYLNRWAPLELKEEWDNDGILVNAGRPVDRVLVALDITDAVVTEAIQKGCQLIVSHHPVIFRPLRSLERESVVFRLAQAGISAVCMHTNMDAAEGGVNDVLCRLFGVQNAERLGGLGRVGAIEAATVRQLGQRCQALLGARVKFVLPEKRVCRLAVIGGSGGSMLAQAIEAGADCLLTGEASHHDGLDAAQAGVGLIVAGHFATEQPIVTEMAARLGEAFPAAAVQVSQQGAEPYTFL